MEQIQSRECYDRNNCGSEYLKPETNRSCIYEGTCFDILRNQDETDIDCGGLICEPCNNGLHCLFDFDCKSGFCHPIDNICVDPTCTDGFLNQGEEDIDCGGPCPPCERPTLEKPGTIVRFIVKGCGPFPWAFVLLASIVTLIIYLAGKAYIKRVKNSPKYRRLKKLKQMIWLYNLNRDLHAFVLIVILLEIAISLYWFYLCEIGIWIAVMMLVIIPLIVAVIIKYYVYDEKRKNKLLRLLVLRHEEYIENIIKLERQEVRKLEMQIFDMISGLDYKKFDKNFAVLFKDIRYLLKELLESTEKEPFELENTLADTIHILGSEENKKMIESEESLAELGKSLNLIEKIHRDILLLYKELREAKELDEKLEQEMEKEQMKSVGKVRDEKEVSKQIAEEQKNIGKISVKEMTEQLNSIKSEDEKQKILEDTIKENPDPELMFMLASRHHRTGKLDKAEELYNKILDKAPKDLKTLYSLASLHNQKQRLKESFEIYKKIMAINPNYMYTKKYYEMLKPKYETKVLTKH
ncbi:hypothetical protein JXC34_00415 [Candidatus Woesearchaeota archaeon]|nr:hypothetical protein [Candidatus Woesearchaeota archaeon]